MVLCNTDSDCFSSNDQQQNCNLFFLAVTDATGVSWDGVCVPTHCDVNGRCPQVGTFASGAVNGRCRRRSNACLYDQALVFD